MCTESLVLEREGCWTKRGRTQGGLMVQRLEPCARSGALALVLPLSSTSMKTWKRHWAFPSFSFATFKMGIESFASPTSQSYGKESVRWGTLKCLQAEPTATTSWLLLMGLFSSARSQQNQQRFHSICPKWFFFTSFHFQLKKKHFQKLLF